MTAISAALVYRLLSVFKVPTTLLVETKSVPEMVKKDRATKEPNPFSNRVVKTSLLVGLVGLSYLEALKRKGLTPPDEIKPRAWGKHIPGTPLIEYNDQFYLEMIVQEVKAVVYTIDGAPASLSQLAALKPFLPLAPEFVLDAASVVVRSFKLENITALELIAEETVVPAVEEPK